MPVEPVLGQITPFAGAIPPRGWALCNGALLAISTNQALFSLLGTNYGGNGVNTFALPDLRGRAIIGSTGGGGDYPAGMVSGVTSVTLTAAQIPAHNHFIQASEANGAGRGASPTNNLFATNTIPADDPKKIFANAGQGEIPLALSTNLTDTGGGLEHNNMQPYLVINYLIALNGVFPSRS